MQNRTGCICLTFLHVFSNVSSNCLPKMMQSLIDCIYGALVVSQFQDPDPSSPVPSDTFVWLFQTAPNRVRACKSTLIAIVLLSTVSNWMLLQSARCVFEFVFNLHVREYVKPHWLNLFVFLHCPRKLLLYHCEYVKCALSNCLYERMHEHIGCSYLTFCWHVVELVLNAKLYFLRSPYYSLSQWLDLDGTTDGSKHLTTLAYSQSQILTICVGLPTAGERNCTHGLERWPKKHEI